jgi:hypothetical protein
VTRLRREVPTFFSFVRPLTRFSLRVSLGQMTSGLRGYRSLRTVETATVGDRNADGVARTDVLPGAVLRVSVPEGSADDLDLIHADSEPLAALDAASRWQ